MISARFMCPEDQKQFERAVSFLVHNFELSGTNPKPVILHSLRVAMHLYELGYSSETIIAGVLHDTLEDTAVTPADIEFAFGNEVYQLVEANTFDRTIAGKQERDLDMYRRCTKAGPAAAVIKAADILDNSFYYHLIKDSFADWRLEKMGVFLELSAPIIGGERVWNKLKERHAEMLAA